MRIAFLVGQFPALSETFVLNQITSLLERGHSVSIFAERRPDEQAEHPDVARFDLRRRTRYESMPATFGQRVMQAPSVLRPDVTHLRALNVLRFGREAASLRLAWAVKLFDGARDFDIVQCHFGALGRKAVLLREAGALRGKIVTAFHGEDITNYPRQFPGNIYAPLFASGDLFLPVSERWNDRLAALGCPPGRIRVHQMGIDCRSFARPVSSSSPNRPFRIVSVARLVEKKGIADAIRAVSRLTVPYEYVVAGDGPLRDELEQLARAQGIVDNVEFAGAHTQADVVKLLHSADVCLSPSVTGGDGDIEGIPISIVEAMAAGLPVVSTRHSAIPELVADGYSGFLVGEHDVDALATRLSELANDRQLRERMGAAGASIAAEGFDIHTLTDRLEAIYRDLLS